MPMVTFCTCYIYRVVCILNNLNELNSVYIRFYQITNFTGETSGFLREKLDYGPVVIFIITLFSEIRSSFDLLRNKKFPVTISRGYFKQCFNAWPVHFMSSPYANIPLVQHLWIVYRSQSVLFFGLTINVKVCCCTVTVKAASVKARLCGGDIVGCGRAWEGWTGAREMEMIFPEVSRVTRGRYDGQTTEVTRELFNARPRATVGWVHFRTQRKFETHRRFVAFTSTTDGSATVLAWEV